MRKLKLQVQMSVDGFIGGPNGEMDWLTCPWDEVLEQYVTDLTAPVDCIVLGRKLAQGFIPHWAAVAADATNPDAAAGRKFTDTPKVVFTRTLTESEWPNTVLARGELAAEITRLKQQPGGDIIAYGGAAFVSSLIHHGLVDEYHLFVNPVAIGRGLAIFHELPATQALTLVRSTAVACGIVVQHYEPKRG
ncbi:dihydrofolate reductase family protein [Hymenobacter sp. 15J16-1T3B]|uniref:dihydrofolate reductase family protein n=1 Tax=Hymenobacter sp. 15J16-1T3B TaxID=2886941 RepID=UPI001D107D28|nr:dihydrofolate reductase family protein [Hymenobacter sp. 15J16-1T3B]MCC3156571.1 dihydrofolate reductase family protein [Hymenobacter sp. 15J16-1T3B]